MCRRRILRHLYADHMHKTYLFQGCPQKFLDAMLAASQVELYRPMVSNQPGLPFVFIGRIE